MKLLSSLLLASCIHSGGSVYHGPPIYQSGQPQFSVDSGTCGAVYVLVYTGTSNQPESTQLQIGSTHIPFAGAPATVCIADESGKNCAGRTREMKEDGMRLAVNQDCKTLRVLADGE